VPTYVYKFVDTGETIEVQQSFHEATLTETTHPVTGVAMPVKKVFQPVGVTFKGSGFYKTDSRGSSGKTSTSTSSESTKSDATQSESSKSSDSSATASTSAASTGSTPSD
jgi:predicted nucleic acid-binding Zn ribbon protein